jgi:alanine dehydrogenase
MNILFLSKDDVKKALTMDMAIEAMEDAFSQLSAKEAIVPERIHIDQKEHNSTALFMPVYLPNKKKKGLKLVSLSNNNPAKGLPLIQALVMVIDSATGAPLAIMDGSYLTAIRTGAASGLATKILSRKNANTVAIFGAGVQGRTQLEAVCAVREIKRALIFDIDSKQAERFSDEMSKKLSIEINKTSSLSKLKAADIICTATTSSKPVFSHQDIKEGVHINAVGVYKPDMHEIPEETVISSKIVVDEVKSALSEAGDILIPMYKGKFNESHIHAEIGEIVKGAKTGRQDEKEITLFKSVGNAVQDIAVADILIDYARKNNLGTKVTL